MSSLLSSEKRTLLEVARRGLVLAAETGQFLEDFPDNPSLVQEGGAFVTLHRSGRLRGCIGQLPSGMSLVSVVAYCAKAAALEDPRFDAVRPHEVPEIDIEISVLSTPEDIAPHQIEVGRHGLIVAANGRRGLLLPQVPAGYGWTAERFLEETCLKVGLNRDAWKDSVTRIQAFTAEVFSESELRSAQQEPVPPGPSYSSST
jgi:AmmeMemoRadiSam system protein A